MEKGWDGKLRDCNQLMAVVSYFVEFVTLTCEESHFFRIIQFLGIPHRDSGYVQIPGNPFLVALVAKFDFRVTKIRFQHDIHLLI
jgi:hypothetical protein